LFRYPDLPGHLPHRFTTANSPQRFKPELERLLDSVKQDLRCNDNHLVRWSGMIVVG